jgi:hypothetical protein
VEKLTDRQFLGVPEHDPSYIAGYLLEDTTDDE